MEDTMNRLIDKKVLVLFTEDCGSKLQQDEIVVYAQQKEYYSNELQGYSTLNRVITINERTGTVTKWLLEGTEPLGFIWFNQIAR